MKQIQKKLELTLTYLNGQNKPEEGYFEGGVKDPDFLKELLLWVEDEEIFNFDKNTFVKTGNQQVNLCGTKRALFELGRYLIALSKYETKNPNYHDHFDEINYPEGKSPSALIVHAHNRYK
jgi:hypothetical protein